MEINDFNEWYLDGIDQSDDIVIKRELLRGIVEALFMRLSQYLLRSQTVDPDFSDSAGKDWTCHI